MCILVDFYIGLIIQGKLMWLVQNKISQHIRAMWTLSALNTIQSVLSTTTRYMYYGIFPKIDEWFCQEWKMDKSI
jgi:hypothetical protein